MNEIYIQRPPEAEDGEFTSSEPNLAKRQLDARAAFGRVPKATFHNIDPAQLRAQITEADLRQVKPVFLEARLLRNWGKYSYDGLLLNETERNALVYSTAGITRNSRDKTLARRQGMSRGTKNAAAERSKAHTLKAKADRLTGLIDFYNWELQELERLYKESMAPGFAHMDELALRMLSHNVWHLSLRNMLDVIATDREMDDEEAKRLQLALDYRLHSEDYFENLDHWRKYTQIAINYVSRKIELMKQNQASSYLRAYQLGLDYENKFPDQPSDKIGRIVLELAAKLEV